LQGNNNIRIHAQYSPALIGSCKQEIWVWDNAQYNKP
jgi:hypothetical protein